MTRAYETDAILFFLLSFCPTGIYGRCTSFPSSPDGREILEIDPGDLSDNGTDVTTSLLGVQQVASDLNLGGVDVIETP